MWLEVADCRVITVRLRNMHAFAEHFKDAGSRRDLRSTVILIRLDVGRFVGERRGFVEGEEVPRDF